MEDCHARRGVAACFAHCHPFRLTLVFFFSSIRTRHPEWRAEGKRNSYISHAHSRTHAHTHIRARRACTSCSVLRLTHHVSRLCVGVCQEWSLEEVAKHNKPDDLFIVVQNKVYDITDFCEDHPGGAESLMRLAGLDNTEGFSGIQHPAKVWDMIQDYFVGDVKKEQHVVYNFHNVSKL